jgi:Glycosyl transferase family 2
MAATFSLLHATYHAGQAAEAVRDAWIETADQPENVEHLFACDEDDPVSMARTAIRAGVVGASLPGRVTAVRNWNAAAAASTGDILVVIADDLRPPQGWDTMLLRVIVDLDPKRAAFVVNVRDGDEPRDGLIRHPVVSRHYYEKYGLFESQYDGIGVDNDFTLAAFRRGVVIDGRSIVLDHQHPTRGAEPSQSHRTMNATDSQLAGKALFARRWPTYKRHLFRRYLVPRAGRSTISSVSRAVLESRSRVGYLVGLLPRRVRAFGRRRVYGE